MFSDFYSQIDGAFVPSHVFMKVLHHMFTDVAVNLEMTINITTLNFYSFPFKTCKSFRTVSPNTHAIVMHFNLK